MLRQLPVESGDYVTAAVTPVCTPKYMHGALRERIEV